MRAPGEVRTPSQLLKLLLGLALVFALFQWSAGALASDRGQAGLIVAALVIAAILAVEWAFFGLPPLSAAKSLGLGWPHWTGLIVVSNICGLLLFVVFVFARVNAASVTLSPDWLSLLPGLFAQAGVAEETLFRGYLFGRLRRGRPFWRAAGLSLVPFVGVHLFLFFTMPWPIALAAVILAVALSFPLAHLYELGGGTIWAPALLHFVVQGTVKVVVFSGGEGQSFPLVWMAASALIPQLALLIPRRLTRKDDRPTDDRGPQTDL